MRRAATIAVALAALGAGVGTCRGGDKQDFAAVERGRYLANAADCGSCHTVPGSDHPFGGGRQIETPFGYLAAPNITPDRETGIGNWSDDEFDAAVRNGRSRNGARLYPAMPYPYYTKMSRQDVKDIRAYLDTIEPVHNAVRVNRLPFPLNIRASMIVWDKLYFTPGEFRPDASKSQEWNRGAYLVQGPAHCGACHTPKTFPWRRQDVRSVGRLYPAGLDRARDHRPRGLARLDGRGHRDLSEDRSQQICRRRRPDGRGGRSLDVENDRPRSQCDRHLSEGCVRAGAGECRGARQGRAHGRRRDLSRPLLGLPRARWRGRAEHVPELWRTPRPSRQRIRPRCCA